ncbi:DUF7660 family protein [Streptomyces acidiscabies]|uniref:DUF7660 family protein n=1 Tax=Streptomyces acidiscabies TaxID=42234 RepID=UPI00117C7085|nr:hypothetical protein [Streptomyces acidiscabies]
MTTDKGKEMTSVDEWPEAHVFNSRQDVVDLIASARVNLAEHPEHWLNSDLDSFLDAMGAFLNDITNMYVNRGIEEPPQPDWQLLATIILAGRDYE